MIPADELLEMQEEFALACDQVAIIKRNSNLGIPGTDAVWVTIYPVAGSSNPNGIPAMLQTPKGEYQLQLAAALVDQSAFVLSFPALIEGVAIDIRRSDQVIIAGMTLTVQHLFFPQSYSVPQTVMASGPR
jgi:hypothetical protein